MPAKDGKKLKDKVMPSVDKVEEEDWTEEWELVGGTHFPFSFSMNE